MDMIEAMRQSEALEICLRNGHVVYGRFLGVFGENLVLRDSDGAMVFVPMGDNLAYVKTISADPEIGRMMDRLCGERQLRQSIGSADARPQVDPASWRSDAQPAILDAAPSSRRTVIEAVKERFRHSTSFASQAGPAYRPRIDEEGE
jgi:hypothetical protein